MEEGTGSRSARSLLLPPPPSSTLRFFPVPAPPLRLSRAPAAPPRRCAASARALRRKRARTEFGRPSPEAEAEAFAAKWNVVCELNSRLRNFMGELDTSWTGVDSCRNCPSTRAAGMWAPCTCGGRRRSADALAQAYAAAEQLESATLAFLDFVEAADDKRLRNCGFAADPKMSDAVRVAKFASEVKLDLLRRQR